MSLSEQIRVDNSRLKGRDYDGLIMLSYAVFAVTFLVLIYAASMSSGTAAGDLASMAAFP